MKHKYRIRIWSKNSSGYYDYYDEGTFKEVDKTAKERGWELYNHFSYQITHVEENKR